MATHENDMVTNDDEYHLYKSLAEVIKSFLTIAETINNAERYDGFSPKRYSNNYDDFVFPGGR